MRDKRILPCGCLIRITTTVRFFPSLVFFPIAGAKDGLEKLAKHLKAEIDEEKIESFRGTISLPFKPGKSIAVIIINDCGIASQQVIKVA